MKLLYITLIVLGLATGALSLTKEMKRFELFCTYKTFDTTDTFFGSYVVSGYNEKGIAFQLFDPQNQMIEKIEGEREGGFQINVTQTGEYRVCFRNLEKDLAYVSFVIFALDADFTKGKTVGTGEISDVAASLKDAVLSLKDVYQNIKYQATRELIHSGILYRLARKMNWSTIIKVVCLALVGAAQYLLLTGLFKKKFNKISV